MRFDLQIIASWIQPGSRVLDLGCGEGDLLYFLKKEKGVVGTGIERVESSVARGIEKGLTIIQGDINEEILDYQNNTFDYVILSQTLQQVYEPATLIRSLLRIGNQGIVSFPNFCHWKIRLQLMRTGHVPVTRELPYEWYDTPNIHFCTVRDFETLCAERGIRILRRDMVGRASNGGGLATLWPNLFATTAIYQITR